MPISLGQLFVELGVNTAAFKKGLDKSTYEAKQAAKEIKGAFSNVGDGIREMIGQFGAFGSELSNMAGLAQQALAPLMELGGGAAVAVAGTAAAIAAAGVGAIGLAIHASEAAAKMYDLSQATGIAVEDLSLLGNIAKTKDIDINTLAKSLEKMDRAAVQAAQGGRGAQNAFKDLGVAVTNADGSMRESKAIFDDVAAKFAKMPDGPQKTAEAMKIFGRGGAALIPVLNEGGEKLHEMEEHFRKLGAVISGPTAEAANELQDNLTVMGAAFSGIENELVSALTPAIIEVQKAFVSFFEENQEGIKDFVYGLAQIGKVVLNTFQIVGLIFSLLYKAFYTAVEQIQILGGTLGKILSDVMHGNFKHIWEDVKQGGHEAANSISDNFSDAINSIKSTASSIKGVWTATLPKAKAKRTGGDPNENGPTDFIEKEVAALERQAAKEAELAKAIGLVSQATIEANAIAEANNVIQKLQDEAAAKGIEKTKAFRDALAGAIPRIREASTWLATFKAAIDTQKEFDNFNKKITEQVQALQDEAAVGTTVERQWAKNNATLLPLRNNVEALTAEYEKLRLQYGDNSSRVQELAAKLVVLNGEYKQQVNNVNKLNEAFQKKAAADEARKLDEQIIKLRGDIDAFKHGDAFLNVAAQLEIVRRTVGLTDEQMNNLKGQMQEIRKLQIESALDKKAANLGFDPAALNTINDEIAALQEKWHAGTISEQEYQRVLLELLKEQADLEAKTGGFAIGARAAFADIAANAKSAGEIMHDTVGMAVKGIVDQFAEMVTTGKAKWQDLITSMEQMLIKSALNSLIAGLFKHFSEDSEDGGGGGGGFFGHIGGFVTGLFGGGHALGGAAVPGVSYLVGERGPEIFTPDQPGSVIPNGASLGGGKTEIHQHFNINTPDADSFRKSKGQILSDMYVAQQTTARRNRG
jgi:hypothetical protein